MPEIPVPPPAAKSEINVEFTQGAEKQATIDAEFVRGLFSEQTLPADLSADARAIIEAGIK